MLDRIKAFFSGPDEAPARHSRDELQFAAAALLVEAARTDDSISDPERARIVALARDRFALTEEEARDLFAAAEAETEGAAHTYNYIRTIINRCPPEERVWIIEMLWEVAYADGELHDLEASLLRRVGGMLAVTDQDRGAARKRVLERMGIRAG